MPIRLSIVRASLGAILLATFTAALHGQTDEASAKRLGTLEPLRYGDESLVVDLGVGLWAWPMPMDWDGDGDDDLVVSCPDVPQNGTFVFENPAGPGEKFPVFRPAVRVGPALKNVQASYADGLPTALLTPGREWFVAPGGIVPENGSRPLPASAKVPTEGMKLRANQWRRLDYDGDGDDDLIVGIEDWSDYGWDDAYDDQGRWTNGPLHGYVFLLTNVGTDGEPEYAKAEKVSADGQPIDTYGMPSPSFADFDGDGDLDLICGEFLDGFTYFANEGTRKEPRYAAGVRLKDEHGEPLAMNVQMITPTAFDWDRDGDMDLIVGDEDGRVALVEHTGKLHDGKLQDGAPIFLPPVYFQQQADEVKFGALVTPVSVDWDGDGDEDLICGNTAGHIGFIENLGFVENASVGDPPKLAAPKLLEAGGQTLRIEAGENGSIQGPAEAKWGYTVLDVADWDGDGALDLIVNSIHGRIDWYRGTGSPPSLAAAQPVEVAWPGEPPRPEWNWKKPGPRELVTQWRTSPIVNDLDEDGLADLIVLDHEGYLAWFRRFREEGTGKLLLAPGERIFQNETGEPLRLNAERAGKSGRRKLCFVDYDGDGKRDLIVNDANAKLLRNVTPDDAPGLTMRFEDTGPMSDRKLAGHTTCPTTVDWDGDGRRELLLGGEDGRLYLLRWPKEAAAGE